MFHASDGVCSQMHVQTNEITTMPVLIHFEASLTTARTCEPDHQVPRCDSLLSAEKAVSAQIPRSRRESTIPASAPDLPSSFPQIFYTMFLPHSLLPLSPAAYIHLTRAYPGHQFIERALSAQRDQSSRVTLQPCSAHSCPSSLL